MKVIVGIAMALFLLFSANAQKLLKESFIGPITGDEIFFNIYLPAGYDAATTGFSVVYHLHGSNGSQGGNQNIIVPAAYEEAFQMGRISEQYIIVFPNGLTNSMWADSKSGHKLVETHVVQELIPYVDAHFNTLVTRENRFIQGFSMGGFGAAKFIAKYPNLFRSAVIFDGALHSWQTFTERHPDLATEMFGDDEAYFDEFSPWTFFKQNTTELADSVCLRINVGGITQLNPIFRDSLAAWGMPFEYLETTCQHDINCLMDQDGVNAAVFQENCSQIVLSAESSDLKTDWEVFPNPTNNKINILMESTVVDLEVSIFSIFGKKVLTSKNQTEIDLNDLSKGTYLLKVKTNGKIKTSKIIKIE